jgi:hypothetical protein
MYHDNAEHQPFSRSLQWSPLCWNIDSLGSEIFQRQINDRGGFLMAGDGTSGAIDAPTVDVGTKGICLFFTESKT